MFSPLAGGAKDGNFKAFDDRANFRSTGNHLDFRRIEKRELHSFGISDCEKDRDGKLRASSKPDMDDSNKFDTERNKTVSKIKSRK